MSTMPLNKTIWIGLIGVAGVASVGIASAVNQTENDPAVNKEQPPAAAPATSANKASSTADHSTFEILQQEFKTGPEVTAACLTCHTEAASQIMSTSHWTWLSRHQKEITKDGEAVPFGKASRVINNFCIAVPGNEPRCTSCHIGYGWKDSTFDFENPNLVDCLVCHDQTGKYKKFPTAAGHPVYESTPEAKREWPKGSGKHWNPAPLTLIAQSVGAPSRQNCGSCHFFGGGGEGVKHGDMDVSLANPSIHTDVHMSPDGANMHCVDCHTTHSHDISGRYYEQAAYNDREFVIRGSPTETNLLACESCHTVEPHRNAVLEGRSVKNAERLDNHIDRVSCQACHIPTMAREKATKMWWDWSKLPVRKPTTASPIVKKVDTKGEHDAPGVPHQEGRVHLGQGRRNPSTRWFNGNTKQTLRRHAEIDDVRPPAENSARPTGEWTPSSTSTNPSSDINVAPRRRRTTPTARIWPVKVHRGVQPYDKQSARSSSSPKLFPSGQRKARRLLEVLRLGQGRRRPAWKYIGEDFYSGELGWIQSEMYWPLAHMVAPAEDAVGPAPSATRANGRMAEHQGRLHTRTRPPPARSRPNRSSRSSSGSHSSASPPTAWSRDSSTNGEQEMTKSPDVQLGSNESGTGARRLLILALMLTGAEIHWSKTRTPVASTPPSALAPHASPGHSSALAAFAIFWHVTSGEWKQYVPTRRSLADP